MIKKFLSKYLSFLFGRAQSTEVVVPSKEDLEKLSVQENYICELSFKLTENEEIDIEFLHSGVDDMSPEEILLISEKYARLIVLVNNGLLKKQFLNTLKSYQKKQINNDKNILLFDNIIFFNTLLQKELKYFQKENEPLVRPSSVFRST